MAEPIVTRVARGMYRVEIDGRTEIVYVAGPPDDRWAFWNGQIFRGGKRSSPSMSAGRRATEQSLTAPMPATVVQVRVKPGSMVKNGDILLVLEAMKMELVIRAPADARVTAVHCQERQLVQPDAQLVDLEIINNE